MIRASLFGLVVYGIRLRSKGVDGGKHDKDVSSTEATDGVCQKMHTGVLDGPGKTRFWSPKTPLRVTSENQLGVPVCRANS